MEDIIKSISVDNQKKVIGKAYDFSTSWLAFAYRISKNKFFIAKKLEIQNNTCKVCNKKFTQKFNLHHVTYSHCCEFKTYVKGKKGHPDCELCFISNNACFQNCNDKTEIVHKKCHMRLHNTIMTKEYRERFKKKDESTSIDYINKEKKWTSEETERFIQLAEKHMPIEMICKELGRNRGGIVARIKKYGFEEKYLP